MIAIWCAFVIDFIIADPYWFPHPVRFMGKYISFFENIWRGISEKKHFLKLGGIVLAVSLAAISYGVVYAILKLAYHIHFFVGLFIDIFLLWCAIALRCLDKEIMKIYDLLEKKELKNAVRQISFLVSRDTSHMDEKEVIRATVETGLENTSDGVVAPLFYMIIGGAPLAMAYKAINTMDSMVGYLNDRYCDFGWFPARLDDWANFIPARLTAFFMLLWAAVTGENFKRGIKIVCRDYKKSKSPNAGFPEAAAAGILGIRIGGPTNYFGEIVLKEYIGEPLGPLCIKTIPLCRNLMYGTTFLVLLTGTVIRYWLVSI